MKMETQHMKACGMQPWKRNYGTKCIRQQSGKVSEHHSSFYLKKPERTSKTKHTQSEQKEINNKIEKNP